MKVNRPALSVMKIPFSEISATLQRYTLKSIAFDTVEELFDLVDGVNLDCTLVRKGEERVLLQGRLATTVILSCDRCLREYQVDLDAPVWMVFELNDTGSWPTGEIDLQPEDLDVVTLNEPVVDLVEAARQQIYMELPMRHVCHESCKGLCPQCGIDLNHKSCSCAQYDRSNPFAVLAALKKEK
jgi:uncharacterized protein